MNARPWRTGHRESVEGRREVRRADRHARGVRPCSCSCITGVLDRHVSNRRGSVGEVHAKANVGAPVDEHVLQPRAGGVDLDRSFGNVRRFGAGPTGAGDRQSGDVGRLVIRVVRAVLFVDEHTAVHAVAHVEVLDDRPGPEAVVHVADDQSSVCSIDAHPLEQGDAVLHPDPSDIGPRRARDVVHADVLEDASGTAPDVQSTCRNAAEGRSLHDGSRPRTDREPQPKAPVRLEGVLAGVIDDQVLEHGRGAKQVDAHAVGRFDGEVVEARIATKHRDAIHRIQHGEVVHARSASEGRRVELDAFVVHRSSGFEDDRAGRGTLDRQAAVNHQAHAGAELDGGARGDDQFVADRDGGGAGEQHRAAPRRLSTPACGLFSGHGREVRWPRKGHRRSHGGEHQRDQDDAAEN